MTERTCEREECDNTFTPQASKQEGGRRQKYCSMKCKTAVAKTRREWKPTEGEVPSTDEALAMGRIPSEIFFAAIAPWIGQYEEKSWRGQLAREAGLNEKSAPKQLEREDLDFDLCDKILCGIGENQLWYSTLADVYWKVTLERACDYEPCNNRFKPHVNGRADCSQYCSERCRRSANALKGRAMRAELANAA